MGHPYLAEARWMDVEFHGCAHTDDEEHRDGVVNTEVKLVFVYHDGHATYLEDAYAQAPSPDQRWPSRILS